MYVLAHGESANNNNDNNNCVLCLAALGALSELRSRISGARPNVARIYIWICIACPRDVRGFSL